MNKEILADFKDPSCEFRGAPFWAWNGKLDKDELRRQIRIMKEMGLGGFFMHSRVGLDTEYLSDDWFECINACIDEAEKLDMNAWLYDEDRWPSGAAGGIVTKNHEYRSKQIIMEEISSLKDFNCLDETIALFAGRLEKDKAYDIRQLSKDDLSISKGETLLHFYLKIAEDSSWYNGQAYLDLMDKKAVKEFINVTHEEYRKRIGKKLGNRVPGIFTDEPHFTYVCSSIDEKRTITSIPWSNELQANFKEKYGYDIMLHLPEIFLDIDDNELSQARYHYHDCITSMFVDAFSKQIGEWCDKNNMMHTGHVLVEDTLQRQVSHVGSCMRFYEYMQAPGMDLLTEHWNVYDTAKQVSSVARQFCKKWRLSETYGCTGWDFSFKGHKALGDWQVALGINLRAQHLSWYTMLGEAKRDYPATINYQSPWWKHYSKVEDYFARINAIMIRGEEVRDLLVIHANETMWTMCKKGWDDSSEISNYDIMFIQMRDSLLEEHIDYDYGDEEIISRHGGIEGEKEPFFRVGKAKYKAILVPPLKTMRSTTLKLLIEFKNRGGEVIFAGEVAKYVDALPSTEVAKFANLCTKTPIKGEELTSQVEKCRRISIKDDKGKEIENIFYLLKEDKESYYLFICNNSFTKSQREKFTSDCDNGLVTLGSSSRVEERVASYEKVYIEGFVDCEGAPLELDPDSGDIYSVDIKKDGDKIIINSSLEAIGSRLFLIPKQKSKESYPMVKKLRTSQTKTINKGDWDILYAEDNVMVLDYPRYRINGGVFQSDEILLVDKAVKESLGLEPRGGRMVQPWIKDKKNSPKSVNLELEYIFNIKDIPQTAICLGIERVETFNIAINGNKLNSDSECGWWCDKSLRKIAVSPSLLKNGENIITMQCDYDENHSGLEIVYLLGVFGVKVFPNNLMEMKKLPQKLLLGDWTKYSLPFYSGSLAYCKTSKVVFTKNERIFVYIPSYNGVGVRVIVDGTEVGIIAWEPNEIDITDYISTGKTFDLRIEVLGHRRNSHGPFHISAKWPEWCGPNEFIANDKEWKRKYNLVPCGLITEPEFLIKHL